MENNSVYGDGQNPLLRTVMIIHFALGMGVIIFTAIVVVLSVGAQPAAHPDMYLHEIMAYIAASLALMETAISFVLFPKFIEKNKQAFADVEASRYQIFQPAHIMRMAVLEGAALFGLVALLLYVLNAGPLNPSVEVILSALPVVIFIALWIYWFPSEQKVRDAVGLD